MRRGRWIICATTMVVAAAVLGVRAQTRSPHNVDDFEIRELVRLARNLPPDFAADALIRLAGSPRIRDNEWRRELIDDAFGRAYGAQVPYARASTLGVPPDSRQGAELFSYTTTLTRLTLQVRAAQMMLALDQEHARDLFEAIELNLTPTPCSDALVPAVDEYYSAVSLFARTSFNDNRADAIRFLELYLWRAHLPSEMPAVARAVLRFMPRRDEASYLEGVIRWILNKSDRDARGFSISDLDIVSRMAALQKADHDLGVIGSHLMQALREYLITQLKGPRCGDSLTELLMPASFNAARALVNAETDVDPIDAAAMRPSQMLDVARIDLYWRTLDARYLHEGVLRLHGPDRMPLPMKVRRTKDWREDAERLLVDLEEWQGFHEAVEGDYFYQKAVVFTQLLDLMPPSSVRAHALRAFVDFLRHTDLNRERRALWFAFVLRLGETASGESRDEILTALENSHHPVLTVYARMQRMMAVNGRSD